MTPTTASIVSPATASAGLSLTPRQRWREGPRAAREALMKHHAKCRVKVYGANTRWEKGPSALPGVRVAGEYSNVDVTCSRDSWSGAAGMCLISKLALLKATGNTERAEQILSCCLLYASCLRRVREVARTCDSSNSATPPATTTTMTTATKTTATTMRTIAQQTTTSMTTTNHQQQQSRLQQQQQHKPPQHSDHDNNHNSNNNHNQNKSTLSSAHPSQDHDAKYTPTHTHMHTSAGAS